MPQTVPGVIARSKGAPVEVADVVVPDPGPGEAVVAVQACGVCHTDLTYREGGINDDYPFLLGHEAAGVVEAVVQTGEVGMTEPLAEALAEFRAFNYEHIYMRPDSLKQSESVIRVLRALVEHYLAEGSTPEEAVGWVGGMTDRYAFRQAQVLLGWPSDELPVGI